MQNQYNKALAQITKKFKILTIFENFLKNFRTLNQNSVPKSFLALVRTNHSENMNTLAYILTDFYYFNRLPTFDPNLGAPSGQTGAPN